MTDSIDRLLQHDARTALPDGGFTARVMSALPAPASPRSWLRPLLIFGSAALGSLLAVLLSPAAGSLLQGFQELVQLRAASPAAMTALACTAVLLVSAVILAVETD